MMVLIRHGDAELVDNIRLPRVAAGVRLAREDRDDPALGNVPAFRGTAGIGTAPMP
jgi:hypothetical protein